MPAYGIGALAFADELRIAALVGDVGRGVHVRHVDREDVAGGVVERRREFVAKAEGERQAAGDLPGVIDVEGLAVAQEFGAGDGDGGLGLVEIAEQVIAKGVAAGLGHGILGGVGLEGELAAGKLVADLIVVLAAELASEAEGVIAADPGEVVDELQRVVVVGVRPLGAVADAAVVGQRDVGKAPLHGISALEAGNADGADGVLREGQKGPDGVDRIACSRSALR